MKETRGFHQRAAPLHHLEQEELQVIRLGNAPQNRVVRRLLTFLDLAQPDTSVLRGVGHDTSEAFRVHEMAAAARCEIASTRQQLHRTIVDFLVAAGCRIDGLAAFRERRRIEHDEVISAIVRRLELGQQVKDVRHRKVHLAVKFIELGILTRLSDGKLGDIDRVHVLRPAVGGIQSKAARMREAIKNASSRRELRDGTLTLHFSQQMVYPMFNKPEIAEKFRLAVQKLTGQNVRVVMQPMDTVTQINQRKIEELAHFPNVTIR